MEDECFPSEIRIKARKPLFYACSAGGPQPTASREGKRMLENEETKLSIEDKIVYMQNIKNKNKKKQWNYTQNQLYFYIITVNIGNFKNIVPFLVKAKRHFFDISAFIYAEKNECLSNWRNILCSRIGRLNIVRVSNSPQIYQWV